MTQYSKFKIVQKAKKDLWDFADQKMIILIYYDIYQWYCEQ